MKKIFLYISVLLLPAYLFGIDRQLIQKTAEHICDVSSQKNKSRIAVYTFTDSDEKETADSEKCTTDIIAFIISCKNLKVIDPTKVKQVMEEQEKGLTGIVDDKTAPETGKLLGADALVFGQVGNKIIQIRLIDATTGEILGANVQESENSKETIVKEQKFNNDELKNEFRISQLRRQLDFVFKTKPGIFLLMTSNDSEIENFKKQNPRMYENVNRIMNDSPKEKKEMFNSSRKMVLSLRGKDKKFDRRIIEGQRMILSRKPGQQMKDDRRPMPQQPQVRQPQNRRN